MDYQVRITAPGLPQVRYRLTDPGPWVLGTSPDCDIPVHVPGVSRHHIKIKREGGKLYFQDLGSTNGTLFNGKPADGGILPPGSTLQLGLAILLVEDTITDLLPLSGASQDLRVSSLVEVRTWSENTIHPDRERAFGVAEMAGLLDKIVGAGPRHEAWETLCTAFAETMGCRATKCYWVLDGSVTLRAGHGEFPEDRVPPSLARACALLPYVATFEKRDAGEPPLPLISIPVNLGEGRAAFLGLLQPGTDPVRTKLDALMALPVLFRLVLDWSGELERAGKTVEALREKVKRLKTGTEPTGDSAEPLLGTSKALRRAVDLVDRAAPTDATLLLTGESGTGKELFARRVHRHSPRCAGPFVAVNCAAIPEGLFEAELFGAEKGAYTGSVKSRKGLAESAGGGTLFLDEVGELPPPAQAKLLRFLDELTVRPLGGSASRPVDVRVVAATNGDLRRRVAEGTFRQDLFYRLAAVEVEVPPLRERGDDILLLANAFLEYANREFGRNLNGFEEEAVKALLAHPWPGNVRELLAVVKRVVLLTDDAAIHASLVNQVLASGSSGSIPPPCPWDLPWAEASGAFERVYFERRLAAARGDIADAARKVGMEERELKKVLARLDIRPGERPPARKGRGD